MEIEIVMFWRMGRVFSTNSVPQILHWGLETRMGLGGIETHCGKSGAHDFWNGMGLGRSFSFLRIVREATYPTRC